MGALISVINQVSLCPITSLFVCFTVFVWAKCALSSWDAKSLSFSLAHCLLRNQWWRIFTAPSCHMLIYHMLIDVITMWGLRRIEVIEGSYFYFRYTLVLILAEAVVSISFFAVIIKLSQRMLSAAVAADPRAINNNNNNVSILAHMTGHPLAG